MSTRTMLAAVALFLFSASVHTQPVLTLVDTVEPLFPDSNKTQRFDQQYEAHFPSGTEADVHILLNVPPGDSFSISAILKCSPLPISCRSQLLDVPVEQNTGVDRTVCEP